MEVITTLIPGGGGDYSLLSSWESSEQRTLSTDEVAVVECQSGQIDDNVGIAGWDTSASGSGIIIRPASGHEHGGDATAGFRVTNNSNGLIRSAQTKTTVKGIVVIPLSTRHGIENTSTSGASLRVEGCVVKGTGASNSGDGIRAVNAATVFYALNNIVYDCTGSSSGVGIRVQPSGGSGAGFLYNNTVVDCRIAFAVVGASATITPKNNIAQGSPSGDYVASSSGTFINSATNISEDTSSPDAAFRSISLTFADAANDDFHLDATDTDAIGAGTDLSADANLAFSDDIDGDARPANNWDIGADQTVAGAANEMSGTPSAQATDASGTMDAVVSGSGAPQAGAATSAGELDTIDRASGTPQAGAATSAGVLDAVASGAGSPQTGAATAAGEAQSVASAAGTAQAGSPTSAGTLMVVVSMSGTPQAGLADGFGTADDGQAPLITAKRKGMIVDVGEVLRP